MSTAPSLELGIKTILKSDNYIPATGKVEDLEVTCPPRLNLDDLEDPSRFHHRLHEWLMAQK